MSAKPDQQRIHKILEHLDCSAGEYRLGRSRFRENDVLGTSCFTTVFRCRHNEYGDVAIKILNPEAANKAVTSKRDDKRTSVGTLQADLWSKLNSIKDMPGKPQGMLLPLDVYRRAKNSPLIYTIMELAVGVSIRTAKQRTPLTTDAVVRIGLGLADRLEFLKSKGVSHQTVCPSNVFIDDVAGFKTVLLEPGLSRYLAFDLGLMIQGEWETYAPYVAPEARRSAEYDAASIDVFGLGGTLYFLLTGQDPPDFAGSADLDGRADSLVAQALNQQRNQLPRGAAEIIRASMSAQPEARPKVEEFRSVFSGHAGETTAKKAAPATSVTPITPFQSTQIEPLAATDTVARDDALRVAVVTSAFCLYVMGSPELAKRHVDELMSCGFTVAELREHDCYSALRASPEFKDFMAACCRSA